MGLLYQQFIVKSRKYLALGAPSIRPKQSRLKALEAGDFRLSLENAAT
jgi:hypothetical protein